jgi:hypothetical protein
MLQGTSIKWHQYFIDEYQHSWLSLSKCLKVNWNLGSTINGLLIILLNHNFSYLYKYSIDAVSKFKNAI